jgi:hypothetical protein
MTRILGAEKVPGGFTSLLEYFEHIEELLEA